MVVAPDEELRARQADLLDQGAGEQHAVERDHDVADHAAGRRRADVAHRMDHAGAAREPDREDEALGLGLVDDHRAPEVEVALVPEQRLQAAGLGQAVVVHQPDQVGAALDGPAQALVEATRAPRVRRQVPRVQVRGGGLGRPQPLPRAVGGGVVDDEDLVEALGLGQRRDEALEQVEAVERDHDRGDASVVSGHARNPSALATGAGSRAGAASVCAHSIGQGGGGSGSSRGLNRSSIESTPASASTALGV